MKSTLCLMVTLLCVLPVSAQVDPAKDLSDNAALRYWMAYSYLPTRGDEHYDQLGDWDEMTLDDARALLEGLTSGGQALELMSWAAEAESCAWAIEREAGPYAILPHLSPARVLARLGMLRARVRLHDGDAAGAVEDLCGVFVLGRAFENDRVLISSLVGLSIESMAVGFAAEHLSALGDEEMRRLSEVMGRLATRTPLGEVILSERDMFVGWWADKLRAAKQGGQTQADLDAIAGELGFADVNAPGQPLDIDQWLEWIAGAESAYDDAARVADLPYAEFIDAIGSLEAEWGDSDNRVISLFMPAVGNVRFSHEHARARLAMLEALLAIRRFPMFLEGDAVVLKDPFGEGRFELILSEDEESMVIGLRSKLIDREGNPVELRADTEVPVWSLRGGLLDPPIFEEDR